ncbi:MAG: histidinol dehydrogenase [Actinobacteria bacterium RBG_16_64_13]|nr:MAG: histidinol dehydrogenase [Actinobacteria bacterium RBG_16_64_13]
MKIRPLSAASVASEVALLRPPESVGREVADVVARLLADVRARGDAAVVDASAKLDWPGAGVADLAVPPRELDAAVREVDPGIIMALQTARENCTFFHRHELTPDWEGTGAQGQRLGIRHLPVSRAGLYVPGGLGSYASTVIMNAVPAVVAGVEELIICTPPGRDGTVNRSVLAAARLMGIWNVFRVGGAQAIAAMAYGTESIPRVDVICGPGNAYVVEAKRQVYGSVGIDSLAGPSEVMIVADVSAVAEWIAADMQAQEEHGSGATAVLVAESQNMCNAVQDVLRRYRPRGSDSLLTGFYPAPGEDFLELAAAMANAYAPEHLEIHLIDSRSFLPHARSAGAVFIGHRTPTAFGDYIAGTNHVLPTGGSARFSSPLSVDTFRRKSSYLEMTDEAVHLLTGHLARLADSEGFAYHRMSAELRAT